MNENRKNLGVLFVCMGNICRSPTAEGVFRHVVREAGLIDVIEIDSAGTHTYHINNPPDTRAASAAKRRGYSLDGIRARRIEEEDFDRFDYIIAMDLDNLALLREQAAKQHENKLHLFMHFSDLPVDEVPDPYYGGAAGFERVLDLVEDASRGLLKKIRQP
jgi:protein-tyrosine phosphatase